ncbi:hypothetical protein FRB97_001669 [Tulasnella sp. 331]|nr:hypothetical protein FRB97_001669 [Tulasnella sp. 331]
MRFTNALSVIAALSFSAMSFAAPANTLVTRDTCLATSLANTESACASAATSLNTDISVSAKADVDVKAMLAACVALQSDVQAFVAAAASATAATSADIMFGLAAGTAVTVQTMENEFIAVHAQLMTDVYVAAKLVASADASVQAAVAADIQACVSTMNAITSSLEAVIGPIYTDLGATLQYTDILSIKAAGYIGISVSSSVYILSSVLAALVSLVKSTLSSVFMLSNGVQVCIGLVY